MHPTPTGAVQASLDAKIKVKSKYINTDDAQGLRGDAVNADTSYEIDPESRYKVGERDGE